MQDLAGARAAREQRVIPALFGVPEPDTLLLVAIGLADETVDVEHETLLARTGARPPRAHERLVEHPVELTHMPESERPQKRPQRRGRGQPPAEQSPRATRPQHITVIDAISAEQHRVDQSHHLPARIRCPRPITTKRYEPANQTLNPQPAGERRHQRDPSIRNQPLITKNDLNAVQSDSRVIMHHPSDLLTPGPGCRHSLKKPRSGGHLRLSPRQKPPIHPQ